MSCSSETPVSSPIVPNLLLDSEDERGIDHDFLAEIVSRFSEDDTIEQAIVAAVEDLSKQLARMTMNDNYKPYIAVTTASCIV